MKKIMSVLLVGAMVLSLGVSAFAVEANNAFTEEQAIEYGVHVDSKNDLVKGSDLKKGTYTITYIPNEVSGVAGVVMKDKEGQLEVAFGDKVFIDEGIESVVLSNCYLTFLTEENVVPSPFAEIEDITTSADFD